MRRFRSVAFWLAAAVAVVAVACGSDDGPSQSGFGAPSNGTGGTGDSEITVVVPRSQDATPTPTVDLSRTPMSAPAFPVPVTVDPSPHFTPSPPGTPTPPITPTPIGATSTPVIPTAAPTLAPGETPMAWPTPTDLNRTPPQPGSPPGTAIVAVPFLQDRSGLSGGQVDPHMPFMGFGESLFRRSVDGVPQPWLATGFEVRPDMSGATVFVRDGVPFHTNNGDFGNANSDDVAWSMNHANSATNPESAHASGAVFGNLWSEWTALDDTTVQFDFVNYSENWATEIVNQLGGMFTVFSKKAFDEKGEAWASDNVVATGPFEVQQWIGGDRITLVNRYAGGGSHYLPELTPDANVVTIIQAPEDVTRAAMMRVGHIDAALIRPGDAEHFTDMGFVSTGSGSGVQPLVFNPNKIVSWEMGTSGEAYVTDTWNLLLNQ